MTATSDILQEYRFIANLGSSPLLVFGSKKARQA